MRLSAVNVPNALPPPWREARGGGVDEMVLSTRLSKSAAQV